jgi:valyl-tRNA synthetase
MDFALRLLHPFMPFITEEIWQKIPHKGESIMVEEFPAPRTARENPAASQKMQDLMDLIGEIRSLRAEMNIDPKRALDAVLALGPGADRDLISGNMHKIQSLARLNRVEFSDPAAGNLLRGVWKLGEFGLDVHDAINVASERERMQKEIGKIQEEIDRISKKINSPDFLARAPEQIVLENRARHGELLDRVRKLEGNLKRLPAI